MIKVDARNTRKLLLISEFLVCYLQLIVIYTLGVFIAPMLLFSKQLSGLLLLLPLLIPATLGLMGVISMLMELVVMRFSYRGEYR